MVLRTDPSTAHGDEQNASYHGEEQSETYCEIVFDPWLNKPSIPGKVILGGLVCLQTYIPANDP